MLVMIFSEIIKLLNTINEYNSKVNYMLSHIIII